MSEAGGMSSKRELTDFEKAHRRIIENLRELLHDADDRVYKSQKNYFANPYKIADGKQIQMSFDFIFSEILHRAFELEDDKVFNFFTEDEDVKKYYSAIYNSVENKIAPLEAAAWKGNVNYVSKLIECGADVDVMPGSYTILSAAINLPYEVNIDVIKLLIVNGADVNKRNKDGGTPLHEAVKRNEVETIKALMEAGANPRLVNKDGQTPLDIAIKKENKDIRQFLLQKRVRYYTDRSSGEPQAKLVIDPEGQEFIIDDVKSWFREAGFQEPESYEEDGKIILFINYRSEDQKPERPKDTRLFDAIQILNAHGLELTDKAVKDLYQAHMKAQVEIQERWHEVQVPDEFLPGFLNAYQNVFFGHQLNLYYSQLPQSLLSALKIMHQTFIAEIEKDEREQKARLNTAKFYEIFSDEEFTIDPNYEMTEAFKAEFAIRINGQWSAFGKNVITKRGIEMIPEIKDRLGSINLDTKSLRGEVKVGLQNILAYGGQLMTQVEPEGDEKRPIADKVEATQHFLNLIFDLKNLTRDSIKKAVEDFERADINRGTGFYRVHSFFTNKRYKDDKGHSRLVKSTMGELVHDLLKAVERAELGEGVSPNQ